MINPEHLDILKQGVDVWNKWRERNPAVIPDLTGGNFFRLNLAGVNFSRSYLNGANLRYSNLTRADLSGAQLTLANLFKSQCICANLKAAVLGGTNFRYANLQGADLSGAGISHSHFENAMLNDATFDGAELIGANFRDALFVNTDLSDARIGKTVFIGNDLSNTKGLETVKHAEASELSMSTVYLSRGSINKRFLRGCGLPEVFITYIRSLTVEAIDFYSCFISYSHEDKSFARRLHDALQGQGIRCWLDEHQLLPGHDIFEEVDRGIRLWDKVLLCCSKHSLTSWWVDNEIETAFSKEQHFMKERGKKTPALIPLNLDGYLFGEEWESGKSTQIKSRLAADFTGWEHNNQKFEEQFEKLVKALRIDGGREQPPPMKI